MSLMEYELQRTVRGGDVENLIKLCETRSHEFFLGQAHEKHRNMLHILCDQSYQACIEESLKRLPIQVVRKLLCQADEDGVNPLHFAARNGDLDIAKLLVNAYNRSSDDDSLVDDLSCPPWRAKNRFGLLPVQVAVRNVHDELAAYLISVDPDVCRSDRVAGHLLAKGSGTTLKAIFATGVGYSIKGFDPSLTGDLVNSCSDESDALLFLTQNREFVQCLEYEDKEDVLSSAVKRNFVEVATTILSNIDISAFARRTQPPDDLRPFHHAACRGCVKIAQLIVDEFNKSFKRQLEIEREAAPLSNSRSFEIIEQGNENLAAALEPPWRQSDMDDYTPLYHALRSKHTKFSKCILLWDLDYLYKLTNHVREHINVPAAAVLRELKELEEYDPQLSDLYSSLKTLHLETFLQFLRQVIHAEDDSMVIRFLKQHLELITLKDVSGRSILQYALDQDEIPVMSLLLRTHPSVINILDGEDNHILITAYRKGNMNAFQKIFLICPQAALRHEDQSTVLHHIRLPRLEEYQKLLKIPEISEFINKTDALGRSPLMKAIEKDDILLVQALLKRDDIDVMNIKSKEDKTAAQMLKEKSKESLEWENLYKKMMKRTSYIPAGTDLKDTRSTLAVVAALLATITFAAAFTVPGGFNQNSGYVILGKKASFMVFILSDTYAMCCSMIVLCSLMWSMVWDSDKALVLIDGSVFVLLQSLYGTLVAFMTGVYTMESHESLWVTIIVCVMCSCVPVSANRRILVTILDKFVPNSRSKSYSRRKKPSRSKSNSELEEISIQR